MYAAVCGSIDLSVDGQICGITPLYVVYLTYIETIAFCIYCATLFFSYF